MRYHRFLGLVTFLGVLCLVAVIARWDREEAKPTPNSVSIEGLTAKVSSSLPEVPIELLETPEIELPNSQEIERRMRAYFPWVESVPPSVSREAMLEQLRINGSVDWAIDHATREWGERYLAEAVGTWPQADELFSRYELEDTRPGRFSLKLKGGVGWGWYQTYYTREQGPEKDWTGVLAELQKLESVLQPHSWLHAQEAEFVSGTRFQLAPEIEEAAWRAAGMTGRPRYFAEVSPGCTIYAQYLFSEQPGSPALMWGLSEGPKIRKLDKLKDTFTMIVHPDGSYEPAGKGAAELLHDAGRRY